MTIEEIVELVLARPLIQKALKGKVIKTIIYITGRVINIVTE